MFFNFYYSIYLYRHFIAFCRFWETERLNIITIKLSPVGGVLQIIIPYPPTVSEQQNITTYFSLLLFLVSSLAEIN